MAERNVLAVVLETGFGPGLRQAIAERGDGTPHVRVVAPARVGPLEWFATDEDEPRAQADARARDTALSIADEADVSGDAGEADAVLAVEDALHDFPADEILVLGGMCEDAGLEASLRRFGLPVTRVPATSPVRRRSAVREGVRALESGRSAATPFVMFAAVNAFLVVLALLIAVLVVLVVWLR